MILPSFHTVVAPVPHRNLTEISRAGCTQNFKSLKSWLVLNRGMWYHTRQMTRQGGQIPRGGDVEGRTPFRGRGVLRSRRGVILLTRCRVLSRCSITANTTDFAGGALNSPSFAPKPRSVRLTVYKNGMTPLWRRLLVADHVLSSHCVCSCTTCAGTANKERKNDEY